MEKNVDNIRKMMGNRNESNQGSHLGYDSETKTFKLSSGGSTEGIKATKEDVIFGC